MDEKISEADKIKLKFEAIWKARDNGLGAIKETATSRMFFLMFCCTGYAYLVTKLTEAIQSDNSSVGLTDNQAVRLFNWRIEL